MFKISLTALTLAGALAFCTVSPAAADADDCKQVAENPKTHEKVFQCPLPAHQERIRCWMAAGLRFCNGRVEDPDPPKHGADNCAYNRRGEYRCW